MKRSLFIKIFLWFWLALGVLAIVIAITLFLTETEPIARRWREVMGTALTGYAQTAAQLAQRGEPGELKAYLDWLAHTSEINAVIFDATGRELSGRAIPVGADELLRRHDLSEKPAPLFFSNRTVTAQRLVVAGTPYIFVYEVSGGLLRPLGNATPRERLARILTFTLAVSLVCYGLARYLTKPVLRLRTVAQQLAGGNLQVRVGAEFLQRQDELADLGRDFDAMAERLETLFTAQKRLLGDVSHELRSPLARLAVALELARRQAGPAAVSSLDRIERETERLNELIGQLLTLSRLESEAPPTAGEPVNLAALVREIAADAEFEAHARQRSVEILKVEDCVTMGSAELLRRAIENVVRNALRYTNPNTAIELTLRREENIARLTIRDHGEGVPDQALPELFRPFYRVAAARDRQTGGIGLGLAITERAVRLHGGTVTAVNALDGGLLVEISLPLREH